MLVKTESCPMCHGKSVKQVENFLVRLDEGWVYTSKILKKNKSDTLNITKDILVYKCLDCKIHFYSPWFKASDASNAFITDISRHQYGWLNLQHALTSKYPNNIQRLNITILDLISKDSTIKRYGEVGCPHQGLNILNFSIDNKSPYKRIKKFLSVSLKRSDPRNSLSIRITDFFKNLGLCISSVALFVESLVRSFTKSSPYSYPLLSKLSEIDRYYLTTSTSYGWSSACEGYGVPCHKLASDLLGVKVVPLWDIDKDGFFDIIGVFNYFDHLSNPLVILDRLLQLSKKVVITVHKPEYAGKQHRVIIGADFVDFLKKRYATHDVELLKINFDSFQNCDIYNIFVLRRKN